VVVCFSCGGYSFTPLDTVQTIKLRILLPYQPVVAFARRVVNLRNRLEGDQRCCFLGNPGTGDDVP